nr:hypothetical protein [Tanacetum cinerariifolium]
MVCVLLKEYAPPDKPDMVKKNLCTMVHVFGTNSWREIPQVPSYPIYGKAVFAIGCLHWLASYTDIRTEDGGRPVIWFDVEKEEFGLIDPPKRMYQVVDLNGEVGYVCNRTMEVWLLNHKKEWVPHSRFKEEIVPDGLFIDVIGCWNKDGDILIRSICGNPLYAFYVYNLKSGVLHKTNLAGSLVCPDDGGRPVIWFDVEKEEFGLIDHPKRMCDKDSCRYQVVDLNGEVGYVCNRTMEVWLLNHKKEWVPHCRFKEEIVPDGLFVDVIGCWNKDGDILIRSIRGNP